MKNMIISMGLLIIIIIVLAGCLTADDHKERTYGTKVEGNFFEINEHIRTEWFNKSKHYIVTDTIDDIRPQENYTSVSFESTGGYTIWTKDFSFEVGDTITWEVYWDGKEWQGFDTSPATITFISSEAKRV